MENIKKEADGRNVLLFLSGGVDSTITFALLNKALGQEKVLGLSINVLCNDRKANAKDKEELSMAQKELEEIELDIFCEHCSASIKRSVLPVRSVGVQGDFRTYRFPAVLTFTEETCDNGETESAQGNFFHFPTKREKIEAASSTITNSAKYINRTCIKLYQGHLEKLAFGDFSNVPASSKSL